MDEMASQIYMEVAAAEAEAEAAEVAASEAAYDRALESSLDEHERYLSQQFEDNGRRVK